MAEPIRFFLVASWITSFVGVCIDWKWELMDKLQIKSIINQFYEELSEKITKTYDQELFSVFDHMPSPIINYNDVGLQKSF